MSNLNRLGIQDAHLLKDAIRERLTIRDKQKPAPKKVVKRNSLKVQPDKATDKQLVAGIYFKKNDRAKRFIMNYYKGDPAGFMDDMRIYADSEMELIDIVNHIQGLEMGGV